MAKKKNLTKLDNEDLSNYELENQNVLINKLWKSMWSGNPKGPSNYEKYKQNNRWYTDPGKI